MTNGNANYFPWEEINEKDELPTGKYHVRIVMAEDGQSQSSGKRMPRVGFQIVAPLEMAHLSHFENYVTGTEEAPMVRKCYF